MANPPTTYTDAAFTAKTCTRMTGLRKAMVANEGFAAAIVAGNRNALLVLHPLVELAVVQIGIEAAFGQQLLVGALLHDVAVAQHQDGVGVADG